MVLQILGLGVSPPKLNKIINTNTGSRSGSQLLSDHRALESLMKATGPSPIFTLRCPEAHLGTSQEFKDPWVGGL